MHAPEHRRGKRLESDQTHVQMHKGDRREQYPRKSGHAGTQRPGQGMHARHRHPHQRSDAGIFGTGTQGETRAGAVKKRSQQQGQHRGQRNHEQMLCSHHDRAEAQHLPRKRHLELMHRLAGLGHRGHHAAQDQSQPEGEQDSGQMRLAERLVQHHTLEQHAGKRHRSHGQQRCDPPWQAQSHSRQQRCKGAHHEQITLHEADRLGRFVDQHEGQRDQAIDAAGRDTAHKNLQKRRHRAQRLSQSTTPGRLSLNPAQSGRVAELLGRLQA